MAVPKTTVALAVLLAAGVVYHMVDERRDAARESALANKLAMSEQTVKIKDGLYSKSALELGQVKAALDLSQKRNSQLVAEAEKAHTELRYVAEVSAKWEKAFRSAHAAKQVVEVPTEVIVPAECADQCSRIRTSIDLDEHLGPFHLTGHTRTNPAEVVTVLEQERPITITVGLTRSSDGRWRTLASSDEPDLRLDVGVSAVDDRLSKKGFWERLSVLGQATVDGSGPGLAAGIEYQSGTWGVAPLVTWDGGGLGGGVQVRWNPFQERR
jgi:hypothetical protein